MKKIIALVLVLALAVSLLAACGQENTIGEANAAASQDDGKLRIVTTIFPEYDWVREILGDQADRADLTMLLDNGVDLHSYQPTAQDILTITQADLFFYVGGESDAWVEQVLAQAPSQERQDLSAMELLADRLLPVPPGIDPIRATTLTCGLGTAYRAVVTRGAVRAGTCPPATCRRTRRRAAVPRAGRCRTAAGAAG